MVKIKICGIQDVATAKVVTDAGVDVLGMVLAPSKRQISIGQAADITTTLPTSIAAAGVFVNADFDFIKQAIQHAQLDFVQLHGDEPADFAKQIKEELKVKVIKAFPHNSQLSYQEMFNFPADLILIDSPRKQFYGGSGETFDWSALQQQPDIDYSKFILAGGITTDNVQQAINAAQPYMIDLSSSLETNGHKDFRKIQTFMQQVKGEN